MLRFSGRVSQAFLLVTAATAWAERSVQLDGFQRATLNHDLGYANETAAGKRSALGNALARNDEVELASLTSDKTFKGALGAVEWDGVLVRNSSETLYLHFDQFRITRLNARGPNLPEPSSLAPNQIDGFRRAQINHDLGYANTSAEGKRAALGDAIGRRDVVTLRSLRSDARVTGPLGAVDLTGVLIRDGKEMNYLRYDQFRIERLDRADDVGSAGCVELTRANRTADR